MGATTTQEHHHTQELFLHPQLTPASLPQLWVSMTPGHRTLSQGGLQPQWRGLQDILNSSFVCYQDLLEYVGLGNIE